MNFLNPQTVLNLSNIRDELVKIEDLIIFNFIERSNYPQTPAVYEVGKFPQIRSNFLDHMLSHSEITHSEMRRYESPDETPFFPDVLREPILPKLNYPPILAPYADEVNVNDEIKSIYIEHIVPLVSPPGEQPESWGSITCRDIECLQALSRRIHFGKFVAEAKFQSETERFTQLIKNRDIPGIEDAITNSEVEERILKRLEMKGEIFGSVGGAPKITPQYLAKIYKDWVIPLTKKVEVDYLLRRLE